MINFQNCTLNSLEEQFNIEEIQTHIDLQNWLEQAGSILIPDLKQAFLLEMKAALINNVHDWNEAELVQHFIGPMFLLVNFTSKHFNHFAERKLQGEVNGILMSGKPDGMVASGKRVPKVPYFCFQEYKKEKDPDGDPAGQALGAMLVAQSIHKKNDNQWDKPVYGCYVLGRMWYFMVLKDQQYAISEGHNAAIDDVFDIFRILLALKEIVISYVEKNK